ncbi:hypothetical protein F4801DRAFT_605244 [Xylaria longipes]|nr:hypothetical protein F4801DRAFT_605244 [Xylaria longipes]
MVSKVALALVLTGFVADGIAVALNSRTQSPPTLLLNDTHDWSPDTVISYPDSSAFWEATERWDIYAPPSYKIAISPATEADVKLARQQHLPFLATGGRHGYSTTLGDLQGGLAIDLSKPNSIKIDKSAATLTIRPGVRFRDIFDPVYEAGFEIQTGTCSCVGMMGATLGGGISPLHGLHGLIIDALISVRIVTADGKIIEASQTSNSELFWGIRGAGQNFGIVVEATYQLHPLYRGGVWTKFDTLAGMLPIPAQLTIETIMNYNYTLERVRVDVEAHKTLVSVVYAGPKDETTQAISLILELTPSYFRFKEITWNEISTQATFLLDGPVCEDKQIYDIYGVNLRNLSASTLASSFETSATLFVEQPAARNSTIVLETWPIEAAVTVPDDLTAYPWRDAITYVLIQMRWDDIGNPVEGPANAVGRKLRSDMAATSGYDGLTG